jgi:hypothetical protein
VIVCCLNALLVYSYSGKRVKSITLSGSNSIIETDNKGNMILGKWGTGSIYSIKDVKQLDSLDTNDMEQCLVGLKCTNIRDMIVYCDTNLWILHGCCNHSKYVPIKFYYVLDHVIRCF